MIKIIKYKSTYHTLGLICPYSASNVAMCRNLKDKLGWKNFTWDAFSKRWVFSEESLSEVKKTLESSELEHVIAFDPKDVEKKAQEELIKKAEAEKKAFELRNAFDIETDALVKNPIIIEGIPLLPYQELGVSFAVHKKKVLIADDMGLGKTLQAIATIAYVKPANALIVCPASLKTNWQMEFKKFTNLACSIWAKDKNTTYDLFGENKHSQILIINYENLKYVLEDQFDLIVFDESHLLKSSKAIRTKQAKQIAKKTDRVICLTGTPLINHPYELISQFTILDQMHRFGGENKYYMRYCLDTSNLEELNSIMKQFTIRRLKIDVLKDLPEKQVNISYLDMPEEDEYNNILRQSEIEYAYAGEAEKLLILNKLRQETARQKVLASEILLNEFQENNIKLAVYCVHRKTVEMLSEKYTNSMSMTGLIHVSERSKIVDEFQKDPRINFLFATIKTIGVGFTITENVSNGLFMELGWTPAEHSQAEDRLYRIGQKNNVQINYLILKNSVDEDILELLSKKVSIVDKTMKGNILDKQFKKSHY